MMLRNEDNHEKPHHPQGVSMNLVKKIGLVLVIMMVMLATV